jgi:DNA-binding XRE family transcriptional regulator
MLERTKKPHTENVTIRITGPASRKKDAVKILAHLGFAIQEETSTTSWRETLGFENSQLPGVFLAGARYREGMTQEQLAKATGIARRHISEMENNKRPIGKLSARKLAEALHVDPRRFLSA